MAKESEYAKLLEDKDVKAWYDNLSQGSRITADIYTRRLGRFCARNSLTPKTLLKVKPKEIQNLLITLVSEMKKEGNAGSYIHSNVKAVKSWLYFNDIEIKNKIKIVGSQETPTLKNEKSPHKGRAQAHIPGSRYSAEDSMYFPSSRRVKARVFGRLRGNEGLKISDLSDVELHPRKHELVFKKIPTMITVRPMISKTGHQYFSFLTSEGCQYVKEYLEKRMRQGELLDQDSPISSPQKDSASKKVGFHITTTNVGGMIRSAIRKAGFK